MKLNPHRMEVAKEKLEKKLSYEYITSTEKYKDLTRAEHKELVKSIDSFCQILIQSYFDQGSEHDEEV